jgi:protein TonB
MPRVLLILLLVMPMADLYSQVRLQNYSTKINDTCWRVDYYVLLGPLQRIESFLDKKRKIANGRFAFYDESGLADSTGYYTNGRRQGTWYYYNDKGKVYLTREYNRGRVVSEKQHEQETAGQSGAVVAGEVESEFKESQRGWQRYLNRNLRYPRDAIMRQIQGQVQIAFVVDTAGAVKESWVFKSVERSLDEESMRLMVNSPAWTPATKDGNKVKSYKIQPIVYRVQ